MAIIDYAYLVLFALFVSFLLKVRLRKRLPLPPGPKGYPLIGNVYDVPATYPWFEYDRWSKEHGEICSYTVFGKTTIIINSMEAAIELLEKRSGIYSDRPRMVMTNELLSWGWNFGHMGYADWWRRHRRMFQQYLLPQHISGYHPLLQQRVIVLLEQLAHSSEEFVSHIQHFVGSVVLQASYGYEVKPKNDFFIKLVEIASEPLFIAVTGNFFVEFLPILKYIPEWFPGAGFKRFARLGAKTSQDLLNMPFEAAKKAIANGSSKKSFVYDRMEELKWNKTASSKELEEEEEIIKDCAAVFFLGGSDTTSALLQGWVLAMVCYPEVQKRGQEEIDKVLGSNKLPEASDRTSMPYIEAMLLEIMRWWTVAPLAVPHAVISEDVYKGYRIPAGATVFPNIWSIMHDERVYPDPMTFKPERFLKDGKVSFEDQPDPVMTGGFGYGRRICPGRYLAMDNAWIAIASILATINISKAVDENGHAVEPPMKSTDGQIVHPIPFKARFNLRNAAARDLIESTKE